MDDVICEDCGLIFTTNEMDYDEDGNGRCPVCGSDDITDYDVEEEEEEEDDE